MTSRQPTTFSYYVIAIDYGRIGVEAIVTPEMTRRGAVDLVREKLGDGHTIAFAHHVTMNDVPEDVKDELIEEASYEADPTFNRPNANDRAAFAFDRARDLRKHSETV